MFRITFNGHCHVAVLAVCFSLTDGHTHAHTHTHTSAHIYTHTSAHIYTHTSAHIHTHTHTHTHTVHILAKLGKMGHAVAQLVAALRYKSEGRGFDYR